MTRNDTYKLQTMNYELLERTRAAYENLLDRQTYSYKKVVDEVIVCIYLQQSGKWRGRWDSNPRYADTYGGL